MKGYCDCCGKQRSNVVACGRDSNGDPEAPDACFICRKEFERRRVYSRKSNKYVSYAEYDSEVNNGSW